jgi:3-oxoacyl-[acyl-carrier protein] reductase
MSKFENKIVVITGSTRGIGLGIAHAFAAEKATVVVCGTKQDACDAVAETLRTTYGIASSGQAVNVSSADAVNDAFKAVLAKYGRVDVLVNNAGITRDNLLIRMSDDEWTDVLRTNLDSVFYTTRAVIRSMMKQKSGRIINISSVSGLMGNQGQANYAASKAGLVGFSKTIAKEYGSKGVTCNVVAPGFIQTEMIDALPKDYLDNIMSQTPLKRLGDVADIAGAVLFLSSESAAYVTGQVLAVDGGMSM